MCCTPVARAKTAATAGATYPQGSQASECLILPYIPNFGPLSHPHGLEEAPVVHRPGPGHLSDLNIFNSKSYSPYILNLGSLYHSHGVEEAPVVHHPGPGHL